MQITIITPVFNGAKYIRQCIENVINQNCDSVEHLIMDGLSTDGTQEIVKEFAENHPHIRLISEKDKGQSDAMNKGIAAAKGEIISFLNVDDFYEPGVFNRILEIFKDLPEPSFVCGNLNIWNADGSLKHFNKPNRISLVELVSNCFEWPYNPAAYFYHKSLHEKTGLYNTQNHFCMDYEFIIESAQYIDLKHVDEIWGNFVMVTDSKTQNAHQETLETAFEAGEIVRKKAIGGFNEGQLTLLASILSENKPMLLPEKPKAISTFRKIKNKIKSLFRQA
jgi:glycosyltransferase involved in cell wall biosynthesis